MGHRVGKKRHSSKAQAKSYARNHGLKTPPSGAASGSVIIRKMTAEEMARYAS